MDAEKDKFELSDDLVDSVLKKNLANILKKAGEGKVLSAREESILEAARKKENTSKRGYVRYAKTIVELAKHLPNERTGDIGVSERHASTWIKRDGFPRKNRSGWNIVHCQEYCRDWLSERQGASSDELLGEKRKREVEILDIKIAEMREELVPIDEHIADCQEYRQIIENTFDEFTAWVSAELRDPDILLKCQEICNRARRVINDRIDNAI